MKLITMAAFLATLALAGGTPDLTKDGVFAFPQAKAKVLCDRKDVRLSAWNNTTHLYIQAVLWDDNEGDAKGTEAARQVKDGSVLVLDLDNNKKQTAKVDREYSLNADVTMPGLGTASPVARVRPHHSSTTQKVVAAFAMWTLAKVAKYASTATFCP